MWSKSHLVAAYGPGLVTGLFCGRLLSELAAYSLHLPVSWITAVSLTAVSILLCVWWLRRYPLTQTWPLLLLLGYVAYPFLSWPAAATALAAVALTWLLARPFHLPVLTQRQGQTAVLLLAGLGFLALYIVTLSPDLLPADNGEFQLIA
ncbi:MAG: hypothetical protein KC441_07735, partial [Anaerolineales bacterium]|nr:hypothetical protein [Anaerolineales bacterium]